MALKSLIFSKDGVFLSSLKRYALSSVVVPTQQNTIVKIPTAASLTQPGRSVPVPLQGPADAATEIYSFTGKQGIVNQGIGTITTNGISAAVVGTGTKFISQLQVGDTVLTTVGSFSVLSIQSNTAFTANAVPGANTNANYFFSTPVQSSDGENIFVKITDQAWRRSLMNRDVPAIHVFGSNVKPEFIKESLLLETDQTLMLEFLNYNTSGAASFAPIAEGRKWQYNALKYPEVYNFIGGLRERKQYLQPYWLTLDKGWSTMVSTSGSRTTELLTCTGDITLILFNVYATAIGTDGNVNDTVLVQFSDAKTMRSMQSQPMPLNTCTGTAQNPMRLASPWIIEPQTQIKADFTNNSGVACKVYLTFHGVAIYTGSSFHGSTLTNENLRREAAKMYEAMSTPQIRAAEAQG